jgi:hypothetical protein
MENDSIFAEIPREGETVEEVLASVEKELQVEEPAESQAEKSEEIEADLKKNEAWKELREERDREREAREALEARLEALEKDNTSEKSEFITSIVGENQEVEKHWARERESLIEEVKRELEQERLESQKKEREEKEHWEKWTADQLSEVEREFKVDFKADESKKNELSKVMLDYSPTDENGNLDYREGMRILTELSRVKEVEDKQKVQVKKDIADATVSTETSTEKDKGVVTSNDIRGKDWRAFIGE